MAKTFRVEILHEYTVPVIVEANSENEARELVITNQGEASDPYGHESKVAKVTCIQEDE